LDEELELEHFITNFNRMFGKDIMDNVVGSITGEIKFYGLTKTSMKLEGLDKHQRLIDSYKKIHHARAKYAEAISTESRSRINDVSLVSEAQ
jgi:ribosomal protein S12 methylthiotransferase accessory factor